MNPEVVSAICWDHPFAFLRGRLDRHGDPRVVALVLFGLVGFLYWLMR